MFEIDKTKCCCFTGHRPGKLHGTEASIRKQLRKEIYKAIEEGYNTFISGMQAGVDVWAALEVIGFKERNPDIKLVCAIPFKDFGAKGKGEDFKKLLKRIMSKADYIHTVTQEFSPRSYILRDDWMVDHSSRIIAVFNGSEGGTAYTLRKAQAQGLKVVIIKD